MADLLIWLSAHLPNPSVWFVVVAEVVLVTSLLSPLVGALAGAMKWGRKGGSVGLLLGYVWGVYAIMSLLSLMTRCRPEQHCGSHLTRGEAIVGFVRFLVDGFVTTLPWQLLWIGCGLGALWVGLLVRRRKLKSVA